ncbi:hypothetical protein ACIQBJ_00030 [Kitasatospora sp. NPDC088391]|uniref:hypothetical protein n=1 Tax=Kitasatospora sp. NPDC088391 TaxID=3364074 RepID=UPI00380F37AF
MSALFLVVVVGAATGSSPVGAAPPVEGASTRRAADVARAWPGSAKERAWLAEYWPWNLPEQWLPPGGFHDDADRRAFEASRLTLRVALPDAPGSGEVRWSGGASLTLPLVPAARVAARLTAGGPCTDCSAPLVIDAVRAGTRQILTSRWQATVPTWEFSVEGYSGPFGYPAVAATVAGPGRPPVPEAGMGGLAAVHRWTATSADGSTVGVSVAHGACDQVLPGGVYETDRVVVLIGRTTVRSGSCVDLLVDTPVEYRLSRPLGDRVLLDAATGDAITVEPPQAG